MFAGLSLSAQEVKFGGLDKSPLDAAHYPASSAYANYLDADDPDRDQKIKVLYSRPLKKDRTLFGELVPFGKDWRLGANEASEITFFQPVEIGMVRVAPGSYTMFAEPHSATKWTFKLSTERFIGGTNNRDVSKDIVHVEIPVVQVPNSRESFSIGFQEIDDNTVHMLMEWGNTRAMLPINMNPPSFSGDDASPMDLVQYPEMSRLRNLVKPEELEANEPQVRVVYSRPQMKGRKIFGELLKYGSTWRVGANQTTEVTFFNDVMVGGKELKAGRYGLFADVNEGEWEFIIHKAVQSWGNANFNEDDVVVKVKAKTEKTPETLEALSMTFVEKDNKNIDLVVGWENTMARLPIVLSGK
ncbi:DUF2911 domain-containing protein [Neolewinella aurantiaca]|uniref:DUF2911 domain-containing protein n=2 Tax=Neolewinella aurantiaca TaxID=2602767 RepID=A0A5C7FNK1_9BACT|nr:DUF2911 domain-containing protein [Neolewinella aurantiaca]